MPVKGSKEFIRGLRIKANKFGRAIALETHGRLIRRTPRAEGRAAANWNVAVGAPDASNTDSTDIEGNQAKGVQKIAQFEIGETLYITNSLDYIPVLEEGRGFRDGQMRGSVQAPNGMIKITAAEMQKVADQAAAKIAATSGE